ncbi:MAG: Asp-tRNA(Asn)/Glu-tRNA(Gln) amidotransferase subunit GatB [Bacilli bacterium]|jgi:aspartyl-tRNA(Asn)/glutamyl-tRNA(Gln) amidotransferase subunit B|nr:Asp-tRNA(Asn)/Glu-tRNA(Gln) amidotransferase subunit GatB [Bacilli bacterium]
MYKVVIGLEVHCELKTKAKVFSMGPNIYSEEPNINVATIDLGFPGVLPVVNKTAVEYAIKTALALNCTIPNELVFDRKNYFYPDLPKGYQITQFNKTIGSNGVLIINVDGEDKKVFIKEMHLEEDTASLDHYGSYSLLNYNRAGVPLIEVVTEPCLHNSEEVVTFLEALRSIFLYCDVSEAKSDKGQMRCDVNISLMKDDSKELGTKVELKNINSFNNVKDAIEYEIKRQAEMLDNGEKVIMETRRFDDNKRKTYTMREKVEAVDYKYFMEPNIPIIKIKKDWVNEIKTTIPMLQYERIQLYMNEYGLSRYDATILVKDKEVADFFEKAITYDDDYKKITNWINGVVLGHINKYGLRINEIFITPKMLVELIKLVEDKTISIKQGKEVFYQALQEKKEPIDIVKSANMSQIQDEDYLLKIALEVINENKEVVTEYLNGRDNVLDYLVGQVMKKTKGKANPAKASEILKTEIKKLN